MSAYTRSPPWPEPVVQQKLAGDPLGEAGFGGRHLRVLRGSGWGRPGCLRQAVREATERKAASAQIPMNVILLMTSVPLEPVNDPPKPTWNTMSSHGFLCSILLPSVIEPRFR